MSGCFTINGSRIQLLLTHFLLACLLVVEISVLKHTPHSLAGLSLLIHCDSVPPTMVFDGSKEQCKGDFKRKLRKTDCHARQTEPYSPWQQAAKGCIRELKHVVSRNVIKIGSPRLLWDHCIEL